MTHERICASLLQTPDPDGPTTIYDRINKQSLGQLIRSLGAVPEPVKDLEQVLSDALAARNRLSHSFFVQHKFLRNSDSGRNVMLRGLDSLHDSLLEAYKAVLLLSGFDLEWLVAQNDDVPLPTDYLPIRI